MDQKRDLIARIVALEWQMFQTVSNVGGPAACQQDLETFAVMRFSQAMSWSEPALESYLDDLKDAEASGRNLLAEKYARMMESTSPFEYADIKHLLPPLDTRVPSLIDRIMAVVLKWEEEVAAKYPHVRGRGRPIYASEDSPLATSLETYLRGELATCSARTLELYLAHLLDLQSRNINGSEIVMRHTIEGYGYASLEEANERLGGRAS